MLGSSRAAVVLLVLAACRDVSAEPMARAGDAGPSRAPVARHANVEHLVAASADAGRPRSFAEWLAAGGRVLHVGDSMVGYALGLQLELGRLVRARGGRYESLTVTAAGLHSFASSRVLEKLVAEVDPDVVIVQLGTNNLTVPHPEAFLPDVRAILAQTAGRRCDWIGPVALLDRPERGMRAMLRANVAPCTFFDSFELSLARQEDGLHPTQSAARHWANAFVRFTEATAP